MCALHICGSLPDSVHFILANQSPQFYRVLVVMKCRIWLGTFRPCTSHGGGGGYGRLYIGLRGGGGMKLSTGVMGWVCVIIQGSQGSCKSEAWPFQVSVAPMPQLA